MQSVCSQELAGKDRRTCSLHKAIRTRTQGILGNRNRRVLWGCLPWGASAPGGRTSRGRTWESTVTRTATLDQTYVSPTALSAWQTPPDWILTTPHDPHLSFPPFTEEDIERLREKFPQDPTAGKWWGWNFKQDLPDFRRLPWWFSGKESACNAGGVGSNPGLGRSPGGGNGNPLQCSCLSNPTDRGAWLATAHGVAKSRTLLSEWAQDLQTKAWVMAQT